VSPLIILDTWHSARVMDIVDLRIFSPAKCSNTAQNNGAAPGRQLAQGESVIWTDNDSNDSIYSKFSMQTPKE
jgi:hypothetical protein